MLLHGKEELRMRVELSLLPFGGHYAELSGWVQYNHKGPYKHKRQKKVFRDGRNAVTKQAVWSHVFTGLKDNTSEDGPGAKE